ncbi:MAG: phosphopantetheine-binding protein [Acidobacteriota bacterium]
MLDALPLTRTGKLDRRALPEPDRDIGRSGERTPPRNDTEQRLAEIWCRWLNVDSVGIEDDFFELGGHSLLATQVLAGVRETFGVDVPLRRVFETPTLEGMALAIAREQAEAVDVDELGALLDDVENLSDEDLERLLADDEEADT